MHTKLFLPPSGLARAILLALSGGFLLCASVAQAQTTQGGVMIMGSLPNFDVRYPPTLPNDLEIIIYGDGLRASDVVSTFPNNAWGPAQSIQEGVNNDPTSPAFGLDCVIVRYVGPMLPNAVGQLLHFGVRLRIGAAVAHQEVWWTKDGVRIKRPCDPHVVWICTRRGYLVCIANPTPTNMYVYGLRFFQPGAPPQARLPFLEELNTNINPQQFGATGWTPVALPGQARVFCIPPWCRIYFRVFVTRWRPIVFQIAARDVPETGEPDAFPVSDPSMPQPNDFNPQTGHGTMAIMTGRSTEEFGEDLNADGAVGLPDFNMFRAAFGRRSEDQVEPPPPVPFRRERGHE